MAAAVLLFVMTALCSAGCADNGEAMPIRNVTDEMLACDLDEFSSSMGGRRLSDWRKLGGDGIGVSAVEGGVDASYSFTREAGAEGFIDRLEFMKTITVKLSSEEILNVEIHETYDASSKTIGPRRTSYFVAKRSADANDPDAGFGPFSYIREDDAVGLMDEHGCLRAVERISTSPIEFFAREYFEYDASAPFSDDDWGYYAGGQVNGGVGAKTISSMPTEGDCES